ncbi:MAG: class I SAM-dependent methyltransferase [Armatimonadetes bacterium]|nr:class I SAM-dependent methyltransferase [Akkermansiaceae bacterium]
MDSSIHPHKNSALSEFSWDGIVPPKPAEPAKVGLFRFIYKATRRNPSVDTFLTGFLPHLKMLPTVAAERAVPGFSTSKVNICDLPRGQWATPLVDTLTVIKAAKGFESKRLLEIGSYKGSTALLLAQNTDADVRIWTLDMDPQHGEAYRGTEYEKRIHRVVGKATVGALEGHGSFDFIFVDADHDYASVFEHTVVAFRHLAPGGVILWHDYHQNNYLHGANGIGEALHMVSKKFGRNIVSIEGTTLAIYSEHLDWETASLESYDDSPEDSDPWSDRKIRHI